MIVTSRRQFRQQLFRFGHLLVKIRQHWKDDSKIRGGKHWATSVRRIRARFM
jgi:hypothetical protein